MRVCGIGGVERGIWDTAIDLSLLRLTPTPTHGRFRRRCSHHWNQIPRMKTRTLVPTLSSPPLPSYFFLPLLFSSLPSSCRLSLLLLLLPFLLFNFYLASCFISMMESAPELIPHSPLSLFFSSAHTLRVQRFALVGWPNTLFLV